MQKLRRDELLMRARAARELMRRAGMIALLAWVVWLTPGYQEPSHYREICEELDAVQRGEPRWMIFEAPPRHGKTDLVLAAVARYLKKYPGRIVGYMTHTDQQARDVSRQAIKFAVRAGLAVGAETELKDPLDPSKSARFWQTKEGGGFLALGKHGAVTGKGIHWLIVDDPFKDRAEAESEAAQKHCWEWWTGTALDRVEPGGSVLLMHQRWNNDDLIGKVLEQWQQAKRRGKPHRPWQRFTYPAWSWQGVGEDRQRVALWPARRSIEDLDEIRGEVGEYDWWSKFMQQPQPAGAKLFREGASYPVPFDPKGWRLAISCDPAATEQTAADHSAIGVGLFNGSGPLLRLAIRRVWRVKVEVPELVDFLQALQFRIQRLYPNELAPVIVEAVGGFKSVPQTLLRLNPSLHIIQTNPDKSKFVRSIPTAVAWNRGFILTPESDEGPDPDFGGLASEVDLHPEATWLSPERTKVALVEADRPWVEEYRTEVLRFTKEAEENDQVDMTVHLWDHGESAWTLPAELTVGAPRETSKWNAGV